MYYQFTSGVSRISEVNAALMPQAQLGAIPEIAGNFGNPDGGGNIDVPLASCPNVYTDNGNAANLAYKASMNLAAAGLQEFENANIPVLFRPLHEMNGNWHWWGPTECTDAQFKLLWQYTFTYLTTTKGLHNLLWVYSVSQGMGNYTGRYPGAGYVDIVGSDIYGYVSGDVSSYAPLVALGHPYAITELGLQTKETDPPRDLNAAIQQFKANMPLAVYFMNWANGWAIQNQVNASPALNDPWVQNRRTPRPADTQPPAAPTGLLVN
jgi:mannan endo-1,4-beta-mannosidase